MIVWCGMTSYESVPTLESSQFVKKGEDMRTEKEIRERKDEIEKLLETHLNLGIVDSHVSAFHVVLEWVLQDSELS